MNVISRRGLLGLLPAAAFVVASPSRAIARQQPGPHASFPSQDPARVKEIVLASHGNLERVKQMLKESPDLAKAGYDLGFGDWETAIGAASHTGRKDIVSELIANGARPDIFTYAMLDNLDVVKAAVTAQPGLHMLRGPHGISMLTHARIGRAATVEAFLQTLPGADEPDPSLPMTEEEKSVYVGKYEHGIEVALTQRGSLSFRTRDTFGAALRRVEEHGFAPSGSVAVRIRFQVVDGRAAQLSIHEPHPALTAKRL